MMRSPFARLLGAWPFGRDRDRALVEELRRRDGDDCRRCRRPLRFDLPPGDDKGPRLEQIHSAAGGPRALDNVCLCHVRCNAESADNTAEVRQRLLLRQQAPLPAPRKRRAAGGRR